jgi:prolyl oligopeptidase
METGRLLGVLVAIGVVACGPFGPRPPATAVRPVVDEIHAERFTDPYRWLEEQDHADVRAWIEAQNQYADLILSRTPADAALAERLRALADSPDVGQPQRGGDFEYFTLRRSGEELAAIYRRPRPKSPDAHIDPAGDYERIVDPGPMSTDGSVSVDLVAVTPDGARMIYGVRDGGQDERSLRVMDVKTMTDTERFPNALWDSVSFKRDGSGFYYVRRSRQTGARVRFHAWGAKLDDDPVLFGEGYGPTAFVSMAQSEDGSRFLYTVQHGWARSEVWLQDVKAGTPPLALVPGLDAHFYPRLVDGAVWMRTDYDAPMGRVVIVDPAAPAPGHWRTVVAEREEYLEDFARIDGKVFATYVRDASNRIRIFDESGADRGELSLPPQVSAAIRGDGPGKAELTIQSFTMPSAVYSVNLATGERTLKPPSPVTWNAAGIETTLLSGTSKDGTRVPVFVTGRADRPRDGTNRMLLGGYGGFNVAQKPRFSAMAAAWIERGGVYAYAVLRGGSEYGEAWHRGGMLTNKQRVFDDFIAAGEALIDAGETTADRLAITGTSNGGLLVGAALTQRPDLFGAVLCGFPDVDILRFNQFTANNNMPALLEYGDAAIVEQFHAIKAFSPYQNVRSRTSYPAVMVWTGDLDTRVPPLAGRKFAAALQSATASSSPVILRYLPRAGHAAGNGLPLGARLRLQAEQLHFLDQELAR